MNILVIDLGGTHARFALAKISEPWVELVSTPVIVSTQDFDGLVSAWQNLRGRLCPAAGQPQPRTAVVAVASPIKGELIHLTNSPWQLRPASLAAEMGLDACHLINDFAAVAYAVPHFAATDLRQVSAKSPLAIDSQSFVTVIGMGTGIGVAHRHHGAVIATEGGHTGFAPRNDREDQILTRLRPKFGRLSSERLLSGMGLSYFYDHLAGGSETAEITPVINRHHWEAALKRSDPLVNQALDWYCELLGSYAGDIALVSGAPQLLIGGGLGLRLAEFLPNSGFMAAFCDKG
ncbi:MAG: glucokinase, partial [Alphaproteobacteria bacterium]|nr:glucokinase [Alphaproteobacteria bacterium]